MNPNEEAPLLSVINETASCVWVAGSSGRSSNIQPIHIVNADRGEHFCISITLPYFKCHSDLDGSISFRRNLVLALNSNACFAATINLLDADINDVLYITTVLYRLDRF